MAVDVLEGRDGMVMGGGNLCVDLDNKGFYGNYFEYPTIFKYEITWNNISVNSNKHNFQILKICCRESKMQQGLAALF